MTLNQASISQIIIYTKCTLDMVTFYNSHFGFEPVIRQDDKIVELIHPSHGFKILLHPMGDKRIEGQNCIKLVFDVQSVELFCKQARMKGLDFGPIHEADGYQFANAKDPSKNSISISSRAYRQGN